MTVLELTRNVYVCPVHGWTLSEVQAFGAPWQAISIIGANDRVYTLCNPCFHEAKRLVGEKLFDAVVYAETADMVRKVPAVYDVIGCRSCEKPIYFRPTAKGKLQPISVTIGAPHFVDCPQSKAWSSGARPRAVSRSCGNQPIGARTRR